ncbi:MAG: hypothetical protein QOG76_4076, partial [Pseudonocardiales bacterium]|nr:hypothetical protein [Pseudonocardiales bacterium]
GTGTGTGTGTGEHFRMWLNIVERVAATVRRLPENASVELLAGSAVRSTLADDSVC